MSAPQASSDPTHAPAAMQATGTPPAGLPQRPTTGADVLALETHRIMSMVESEAEAARLRIGRELLEVGEHSERMVTEASAQAERIREHAQHQARQLLGEVEEIISESQQTGQEILTRADTEAANLRNQAELVLAQAQDDARKIVETARLEGEQILSEQRRLATVRAQEALREQDRLKDQIRRLEERRRQVLESLEPLIDQLSQMVPAERSSATGNVTHLPLQ